MQTIETGYRPEGALGALYAGQNAANAQSMNDEELSKLFLANQIQQQQFQQNQQTNPLDITRMQNANDISGYEAAYAKAKQASPDYIPMNILGQMGQMRSQDTASKIGEALMPTKIASEKGQQENEAAKQGVLWTMQDIDKKLAAGGDVDAAGNVVPMTPNQIGFMTNKRKELENQLKSTPEFAQKKEIADDKAASAASAAQIRAQAMIDAAAIKAEAAKSLAHDKTPVTAEAAMTKQIMQNSFMDENEKHQLLQNMFNAKQQSKNATGENLTLIQGPDGKLTMGQQAVTPPVKNTLPGAVAVPVNTPKVLSEQDKAAAAWASANPTDPRAIAIKAKLGI